ncbi:MAG: hypothetical protein APR54_04710 [Candidatus Cloacimonas sp. SDB]|nr:MAG: hypothetical protein APR54_04710 [Candidatus Cloacimonas sp. SDB]
MYEYRNRIMRFLLIVFILSTTYAIFADCRMLVIMGKDDNTLSGSLRLKLDAALDELGNQSIYNPDGWGLLYYDLDGYLVDQVWRSDEQASESSDYTYACDYLENASNAHLVMGHVRNATTGDTDIDDPHPFIFNQNDIDFTFAHNGTVDKDDVRDLIEDADDVLPEEWLETHPPDTHGNGDWHEQEVWDDHVIDSEIYFLWLMLNIHLENFNILEGMRAALSQMDPLSTGENRNFVFSDGVDIYAYRNSSDNDHDLEYKWNEGDAYWIVMSDLNDLATPGDPQNIPDDGLLYLSPTGKSVMFHGFSYPNMHHCRTLHEGCNWESFPVFPTDTNDGPTILDDLTSYGITEVEARSFTADYTNNQWSPSAFDINDTQLFKISMTNDTPDITDYYYCFYTEGLLRDSTLPNVSDIEAYETYWIGYNLLPSQRIDEAFGEYWDDVRFVRAENWNYSPQVRGFDPEPPIWSPVGKYLEFGKGYEVSFNCDITDFTWNYRHYFPFDPRRQKEAELFTFNDDSDYFSIDVLDNNFREEILEIGVIQDGQCIGATRVISLPVQILTYPDQEGGELTFEVYTGERSSKIVTSYDYFNLENGNIENGVINPNNFDYAIVRFNELCDNETPVGSLINLTNYPNPFNPITTISFNLTAEEARNANLTIYNLKGQKVKMLPISSLNQSSQSVIWDGTDSEGSSVPSGVYFYKLKTTEREITKRMILMK